MVTSNKSHILSFIAIGITFFAIISIAKRGEPVVIKTNLENLPMQIGTFNATEDRFPDSVYDELNADLHLYRHYHNPEGTTISLYIGYYGTAKGGRTGHNPYACLPGAGWGIIKVDKVPITYKGRDVTVNALVAQKGNVFENILHWYQSDKDKVLATGFQQNIQRLIGRIKLNRNDGAFMRLSMLTDMDGLEESDRQIKLFSEKVLALLPDHWPEER